jgi:uracil-DNA glycosylase
MKDLFTELMDSLEELPSTENYSSKDRFTDFRQVFTGTEQGKRVYRELLSWGGLFNSSVRGTPIDPLRVMMDAGQRNFATKLMAAVNIEPPEKPTKAAVRNIK